MRLGAAKPTSFALRRWIAAALIGLFTILPLPANVVDPLRDELRRSEEFAGDGWYLIVAYNRSDGTLGVVKISSGPYSDEDTCNAHKRPPTALRTWVCFYLGK